MVMAEDAASAPIVNRYDRMEVAGASGDLGTLVPFIGFPPARAALAMITTLTIPATMRYYKSGVPRLSSLRRPCLAHMRNGAAPTRTARDGGNSLRAEARNWPAGLHAM